MSDDRKFCEGRCKMKTVRETRIEKKTTTGYPSGHYGIWQVRQCINCPCHDGRWKPKSRAKVGAA